MRGQSDDGPTPEQDDPERQRRRLVRRRRMARLKAADLGRSRGGLTSKIHLAADSPRFTTVMDKIKVCGPVGRPRTRPGAAVGDKAYSSRANRVYLRRRRIAAVIPEKADQAANAGGRDDPAAARSAMTPSSTSNATPSSAVSIGSKNGGAWPPATTRRPTATWPDSTCADPSSGYAACPHDPNNEQALTPGQIFPPAP